MGENLLLLLNCAQDSTHDGLTCNKAIDGNTNQSLLNRSCTHSNGTSSGWWRAETAKPANITKVRIYDRTDFESDRLSNFDILIDGVNCATYQSTSNQPIKEFQCRHIGKEIKIVSRKPALTLCEVQVFGQYLSGDFLRLSNCAQDSTLQTNTCNKAIDGDSNQDAINGRSCSNNNNQSSGWWMAEPVRLAFINYVYIYGRTDNVSNRLTDFDVLIDDAKCSRFRSTSELSSHLFHCDRIGKEIKIVSRKAYLILCEVQAFGEYLSGDLLRLTNCSQDTTYLSSTCDKAIDGNTNQDYELVRSCSHTDKNPLGGWWSAETTRPAFINYIRIYGRTDRINYRLTDFDILVDGVKCAAYSSSDELSIRAFQCGQIGKQIKIVSRKEDLTLCEVQVYGKYLNGDLLPLSNCAQGSIFKTYTCNKAIDGNTNQDVHSGNGCAHTNATTSSGWWKAETAKPAVITKVRIYGRTDYNSSRLTDFDVLIDGTRCATYQSTSELSTHEFQCRHIGKEIKIVSRKAYLTLCEVQAFGEYLSGDLLPLSNCAQDSTFLTYTCSKAIDGSTNQNMDSGNGCAHSNSTTSSGWWMAQTEKLAFINYVYIYGRTDYSSDRLTDFDVLIDGAKCATYKSTVELSNRIFQCRHIGKEIKIVSRKPALTLCEVQVFGEYLSGGDLAGVSGR